MNKTITKPRKRNKTDIIGIIAYWKRKGNFNVPLYNRLMKLRNE